MHHLPWYSLAFLYIDKAPVLHLVSSLRWIFQVSLSYPLQSSSLIRWSLPPSLRNIQTSSFRIGVSSIFLVLFFVLLWVVTKNYSGFSMRSQNTSTRPLIFHILRLRPPRKPSMGSHMFPILGFRVSMDCFPSPPSIFYKSILAFLGTLEIQFIIEDPSDFSFPRKTYF